MILAKHHLTNPESILELKDIHNAKEALKNVELGNQTPIQALMQGLDEHPEWFMRFRKDEHKQITSLFFSH